MRRAFFLVGGAAAAAAACQLLVGIDDRTVYTPGDGGGPEGSTADPCNGVGTPPAPPPSTSSPADKVDAVFALYAVDTGTDAGTALRPWGFNLDSTCTCPGPASCTPPNGTKFCDYEGGVDDEGEFVFTDLQKAVATLAPDAAGFFADSLFNTALQGGKSGLLIRVREYNGQADDALVKVAIYSSPGYDTLIDAGPGWDGGDPWRIDQSYVGGSVDAPVYEVGGWVANYTLVASPAQIPIVIGSSSAQPVRLRLDTGHIMAKILMSGGAPVGLDGTLAGRWKAVDFLQGLQEVPDPVNMGSNLCGTSLTYTVIRNAVCAHRDLMANKDYDNQNAICDAVSFGIGFQARRAAFGAITAAKPPVYGCDAGWVSTCP